MMYKDKDKQREANRQAQARFKAKGITKSITIEGITCAPQVIPEGVNQDLSMRVRPKRGKDIKCLSTLDGSMPDSYYVRHKAVTGKPGDADYNGICTPEWIKEKKGVAS